MAEWTDNYRKGDLTGAEINYGRFRLLVHHYLGCGDAWFVTCYGVIDRVQLETRDFEEAKFQASARLQRILRKAIKAMEA